MNPSTQRRDEIAALPAELEGAGYVAEPALAAALLLMLDLGRPLLVEGLDVHAVMYEWNYQGRILSPACSSAPEGLRLA